MDKVDYKKAFKGLYLPPTKPVLIDIPPIAFAAIDGEGSPDSPAFQAAVGALYAMSYSIKMLPKAGPAPTGYYEYTIFPLEGLWDMHVAPDSDWRGVDRDKFIWTMMIRQPDFVTPELFADVRAAALKKKGAPAIADVRLEQISDGLSVQMMHLGPYSDEPASFARMAEFCAARGIKRVGHRHREIYLSDPNRTAPEKMRTVLRHPVSR